MMEVSSNTPQKHDIVSGSPLADTIKDLEDYGKIMRERLGQEALTRSLSAAAGLPEEHGDYFID